MSRKNATVGWRYSLSKKVGFEEAPSDEGAVSEADWGRDAEKSFLSNKIFGEIRIFSLPQSPTAPCCGTQNSLLAFAHRILTAATPCCSLYPPPAALATVPLLRGSLWCGALSIMRPLLKGAKGRVPVSFLLIFLLYTKNYRSDQADTGNCSDSHPEYVNILRRHTFQFCFAVSSFV